MLKDENREVLMREKKQILDIENFSREKSKQFLQGLYNAYCISL
jgi:hypothetical protein